MTYEIKESIFFKNSDSPFTELFSMLKRYENSSIGSTIYTSKELRIIQKHTDNAIEVLLQGLQGVGQLIGLASDNKKIPEQLNQIGFLISAISNLTEALNELKLDADFMLKKQGKTNPK